MRSSVPTLRWVALGLLGLYSVVVYRLTLLPSTAEESAFVLLYRVGARLGFSTVSTEALANVALFVPVGFLLAIVLGRVWAGVLLSVLASAAIEISQALFLPDRVPSLADVEHNGLGGLLGALVAWPLVHWLRGRAKILTTG